MKLDWGVYTSILNETIDKDFEDTILDLITKGSASHYIEKLYFLLFL